MARLFKYGEELVSVAQKTVNQEVGGQAYSQLNNWGSVRANLNCIRKDGGNKSQVTRFVLGSQDKSREMSGHKYPLLPFHFFALAWPCV